MDPHTQSTASRTSYGVLLAEAATAADLARTVAIGPFDDAQHAADVATDFERFLAIGGRHLALLVTPSKGSHALKPGHRDLAQRLTKLSTERRGDNAWADAGDRLGLAHDVLATHIAPNGALLSAEAEAFSRPGVQAAAFARVVGLIGEPLGEANRMLTLARSIQSAGEDAPLTRGRAAHLRQESKAAQRLLAAVPPIRLDPDTTLEALDSLGPTITKAPVSSPATGVDALRGVCCTNR